MKNELQTAPQIRASRAPYRMTATTVGVLYLAAMVAYGAGNALVQSALVGPDHLAAVAANSLPVAVGALLMLINSAVVLGHGVVMFPVLGRRGERLAFGYLGARMVEAIILAVGVVLLLAQIPLGREYVNAGIANAAALQALSAASVQAAQYAYEIGMIAVGVAGLVLGSVFYRARLVPRLLAAWGVVGYAALLGGSVLEVLGFGLNLVHVIPGGLWELFIGVWLIARGFSAAPVPAEQAAASTTPLRPSRSAASATV